MADALEIVNLRKHYPGFTLRDISLRVPEGYVMGLIGPNGAGKTTIMRLIMNLTRRDGGEIRVFGLDLLEHEVPVKARIGFVYDEPCFPEDVTLENIKRAVSRFYPTWDEDVFGRLARTFELPLKKWFKRLSHGTKMKFALALALAHHADFILMDEPTSGLDPVFRREFLMHLRELLQDERRAILFSTHITTDLERIADFVTFVRSGELVFSAARDEIQDHWGIVKGERNLLNGDLRSLLIGARESAYGAEALTSNAREVRRRLGAAVVVEQARLEDIMLFMERGGPHA
ncbi:MAG: ABC transporter ATP-binding protein [Acidobacteria bacterium]|nr:MAG: ABC transporter ATP-binding protein [Acidobacteriota bacterium]